MSAETKNIHTLLRDPNLCRALIVRLKKTLAGKPFRFMEVCGTHTAAIFQSGLRSLLPQNVTHLSGPGCPVCVTHEAEIALALEAGALPEVIIATYGDLVRVPGPSGQSLASARADGARVEIVYSPLDAVNLAAKRPDKEIIFLGVGFETTAPGAGAAIKVANQKGLTNFSLLSFHKLVPPALRSLAQDNKSGADAFLLPGHVAAITGLEPFKFLAEEYDKPAVVAGFEPVDILLALNELAERFVAGEPAAVNLYERVVPAQGNPKALAILNEVFVVADSNWRGLGYLSAGGLAIAPSFAQLDAAKKFSLKPKPTKPTPGCRCGDVLRGEISPPDCPLFGKACSPANPVGPCMVSSEGGCAAYYKYGDFLA